MSIENMEAWHSTLTELENVKEIVDKHLKPRISELEKENDALQKKLDDMRGLIERLKPYLIHIAKKKQPKNWHNIVDRCDGEPNCQCGLSEILDSYRNSDKGIEIIPDASIPVDEAHIIQKGKLKGIIKNIRNSEKEEI